MKESFIIDKELIENIVKTLETCQAELAQVRQVLETFNRPEEELLTPAEAAKILKVSRATVGIWTKNKILNGRHIGNQVRYLKSHIIAVASPINQTKRRGD